MSSFFLSKNQKNTFLFLLAVLLFGKFLFRFDWNFFIATTIIFVAGYITMFLLSFFEKRKADIQNTTIILVISSLLFTQLGEYKDILMLALTIVGLFVVRSFIRYRKSPIINPVIGGGVALIVLDAIFSPGTFTSWHGVNYGISIGNFSFPFGTTISILLAFYVIWKWKKYAYALGFFSMFGILAFFFLGKSILLDGTLYFFFGVMALEPKTTFSGKYPLFGGAILGLILGGFLHFHVIGGYVSALFVQNILSFLWRFRENQKTSTIAYKKGQKWFCIPCGFIYDPTIGDADSGILPGTEFIDIPDDWSCPVCGVTKSDFVPYDENHIPGKSMEVQVVEKKMLNSTTLELSIETKKKLPSLPGQFVSFLWEDALGQFVRSYSIAKHEGKIFTFLIKIDLNGRGGKILQEVKKGDTLRIRGVFGKFLLKNTKRPKIFIATGTGLAPIYNMLTKIPEKHKKLYFSVSTKDELFYEDKINSLQNLESHIHITRENIVGYQFGRIDIKNINTPLDTEWYLCGNPKMIEESKKILESRGFTQIFTEEFS